MDLTRRLRRRLRSRDEAGFGLVELIVAATVMFVSLTALAYAGTVSFIDISVGRQRQAASGLADRLLEQVRALPFDTVAVGLHNGDLTGDPNITTSGSDYLFDGEVLRRGTRTATITPLYPHRGTTTLNNTQFATAVYVTEVAGRANTYRVVALVSWANAARVGAATTVRAETVVYSGAGCQGTATHPFAAPCQPFRYATSTMDNSVISLASSSSGQPVLPGIDLEALELVGAESWSNLQSEQITSVQGRVTTSGVNLRTSSSTSATGQATASSGADNDPSQSKPEYDANDANPSTSLSLPAGITVGFGAGDTGRSASTISANATNVCKDTSTAAGANQTDDLPCGRGQVRQGAATLGLSLGGGVGAVPLVSLGAASSDSAAVTHLDDAPTTSCSSASGDGCVHSSVRRALGDVRIGGLPSLLGLPSLTSGLVELSGYVDRTVAEAGVGASAPSAQRVAGQLRYYNPASCGILSGGYCTVNVASQPAIWAIPTASIDINVLGIARIQLSANLTLGGGATTSSTPCAAGGCYTAATASATAPISGTVSLRITALSILGIPGVTLADVNLDVDLGTVTAKASYTPAP